MGQPLSLFGDYSGENAVTNYTGLVMRLLYERSPAAFEEFLNSVLPPSEGIKVGPAFEQQVKLSKSIPDLAIRQRAFAIFFETKLSNWFYNDQIRDHLSGIAKEHATKVLFLLSNFEEDNYDAQFAKSIEQAEEDDIVLRPLSFEDLLEQLEKNAPDPEFSRILSEFSAYLDRSGLLPAWKYLLDVVNCASTMNEVSKGAYMCPDTGGSYSHRRARYFGPYAEKTVSQIHEIRALVAVAVDQESVDVRWQNTGESIEDLTNDAISHVQMYADRVVENASTPLQVFLLGEPHSTNFRKDSRGGMFQSKKYFWDIARDCSDAKSLADKLTNRGWSDF